MSWVVETFWAYVKRHGVIFGLAGIILIAVLIRVWSFPYIPNGLNPDETAAGYEAASLLQNGTDRWGNHLPAYFPGWGSGQNVLYSYLTVPMIALFGMTEVSVRLVSLIFGILAIPLLFLAVRRWYGAKAGLIAAGILAISPWHFMLSRWSLESNLLPFFLLLGVYTFSRAIQRGSSRLSIALALIPFAIGLYAYGIGVVVIGSLMALLLVFYRKDIWARWRTWALSVAIFCFLALPFGLFLIKNYLLKVPLAIERFLPFSIPNLTHTRLSEIAGNTVAENAKFIAGGFHDKLPWNSLPDFLPLFLGVLLLAAVALVYRIVVLVKSKGQSVNPFLLWMIACIPLFLTAPLNINQSNAVYLPIIILAADGITLILRLLRHDVTAKRLFIAIVCVYFVVMGFGAVKQYFSEEYATATKQNFSTNFSTALDKADRAADGSPLYVTESVPLNYVQTLWYLEVPVRTFLGAKPDFGEVHFENYYFVRSTLPEDTQITFLLREGDQSLCEDADITDRYDDWIIGTCH